MKEDKNIKGIVCEDISYSWMKNPGANDFTFKNISFNIQQGEFISFIGPSGCGKSTLLNIISGLVTPFSGRALKDGIEVTAPNKDLGFVFQDYSLFPWLSVKNNVAFGLNLNGRAKGEIEEITDTILKRVGLWDARLKTPGQLSGGMKQRTAIARVLANNSNYLLMDEPFGALDYQTRLNMQRFLSEICIEFNKTVLFVTHHVEEAIMLSDRVFLMSNKQENEMDEINIDLSKPRDITDRKFNEYRKYIINHLDKEVNTVA
jgi:NitT/TauT family transport system ATP-binding protein